MNTEEKLNWLKLYFTTRRGVGHTYTMIHGVKSNKDNCAVLVRNSIESNAVYREVGGKGFPIFSWDGDGIERMRGLRQALVIDNNAMISILGDALEEIRKLRVENAILFATHSYIVPSREMK